MSSSDTINIGGINIVIGATSGQLKSQLTAVQKQFNQLQSAGSAAFDGISVSSIAAALGIGAAFEKVVSAINETIDAANQLGRSAQQLGIAVPTLGKLEAAATQADLATDDLSVSLKILASRIAETDPTSQGALLFRTLGVNVKDASGQIKDSGTVLLEVADKFSSFRDGVNKTSLAIQLFGRNGPSMIPFLNQGSAAIKAAGDAAAVAGNAIDQGLVDESKKFNDSWTTLKSNLDGGLNLLTKEILPGITGIADAMGEATAKGTNFHDVMVDVADVFKLIMTGAVSVWTSLEIVGSMFDTVAHAAYDAITGDFNSAQLEMIQGSLSVQGTWNQASHTIQRIWGTEIPDAVAAGVAKVNALTSTANMTPKDFSGGLGKTLEQDKPQAPKAITSDDITRQMTVITQTSKGLNDELTRLQTLLGIQGTNINQASASWQQYDVAANAAAQKLQALQQIDLNNILDDQAISTYTQKWDALTAAVQRGTISVQQYDDMNKKLRDNQLSNLEDLATQTATTITDIFGKSKGAAIASAIINTAVGITKALSSSPPPYNFAMAALVAASGVAQIASIRSTTQDGGGGGSTGASASAASQAAATSPASAAPQQTLNVVGINPNSLFTGDAVRNLATQFMQFQKDGGKVIFD